MANKVSLLEQTEALVYKAIEDNAKEIESIQNRIAETHDRIDAIELKIEEMKKGTGDLDKYIDLVKAKDNAVFKLSVFERMLTYKKTDPMIGEAEYKRIADTLFAEYGKINEEQRKKVFDLFKQMIAIYHDNQAMIKHANEVLGTLQHTVYKNKDIPEGARKGPFIRDHYLQYRDTSVSDVIANAVNNLEYANLMCDHDPRSAAAGPGRTHPCPPCRC